MIEKFHACLIDWSEQTLYDMMSLWGKTILSMQTFIVNRERGPKYSILLMFVLIYNCWPNIKTHICTYLYTCITFLYLGVYQLTREMRMTRPPINGWCMLEARKTVQILMTLLRKFGFFYTQVTDQMIWLKSGMNLSW